MVTPRDAADWRAADLLAAAEALAAADLLAAYLLTVGLAAAADGAGLPDDALESDAKAAVGTAIAVAAMAAATARRRLRTDMTRSFMDRTPASPVAPPKTDHPATLKEPRNPQPWVDTGTRPAPGRGLTATVNARTGFG